MIDFLNRVLYEEEQPLLYVSLDVKTRLRGLHSSSRLAKRRTSRKSREKVGFLKRKPQVKIRKSKQK